MFVPILNIVAPDIFLHIELLFLTICLHLDLPDRVGQSVESALIALAAIFWLIERILTIFDKKYHILMRRIKRESY